ncbi:MAG: ArnT family glycosyltransferase [Pyrinomonadaceae bacterium]
MSEIMRSTASQNSARTHSTKIRCQQLVAISALIFSAAFCVRLLVWQGNGDDARKVMTGLTAGYKADAQALFKGDVAAFFKGSMPPVNADVLAHPPGYSILMAALFSMFGEADSALRLAQIIADAAAAVTIFFIAIELLPKGAAIMAGMLVALSPQLAYNSLLLLPDSLAVLPILLAIYFIVRARKQSPVLYIIAAGVLIGLSCWLRANALLLALFLSPLILVLFQSGKRFRLTAALLAAAIVVVMPMTVRNLLVFQKFIPISLGTGVTLIEGIADYDGKGKFGLPPTDIEVMEMEAKAHNRLDYAASLYNPDGIERERRRIALGMAVVQSHPVWFFGVMIRRAASMLRSERVPVISSASLKDASPNASETWLNGTKANPISSSWTRYPGVLLKVIQKLFITAVMLPLIVAGIVLLARARQSRTILILLAVPAYYLCVQSPLHTEYRYVLAINYFLYIFAATTLYHAAIVIKNRYIKWGR